MGVKKIISKILFVFVLTTCNSSAYSIVNKSYSFKQISHEQGLPGINLRDQIQDEHGIMWICVESIGLCKYDGHKFTLYKNNPLDSNSISSNYANKVVEDFDGNLWIATDNGLNIFYKKDQIFKAFFNDSTDNKSLPNNFCKTLLIDKQGNLWIGTENGLAVKRKDSNTFERYFTKAKNSINKISILDIYEESEDVFLLATNNGLIKFSPSTGQYKIWAKTGNSTNEPIHNRILDIVPDNKGYLWIATHRGLDRFNLETETFDHWTYNKEDQVELELEGINSILIDKFGSIWVGTYTRGLIVIDPLNYQYTRFSKNTGEDFPIRSNHIRYIFEDNMGLIWIGTKFEGLFKYNDNSNVFNNCPKQYNIFNSLKNTYILSFHDDLDDNYWIGTKYDGLYKIDNTSNKISNFRHEIGNKQTISSNRVQYILRDSKRKLWIGTESGLCLLNENDNTFKKVSNIPINWLCEDNQENIWVGTTSGIYVKNKGTMSVKPYKSKAEHLIFSNNNIEIMQISTDSEGTIWFTTRYNGLHSYNQTTDLYKHYLHKNDSIGISGNMARSILEDSKGNFWIGTKSQGLNLLNTDKGTYTKYTINDGLPSNMILSIEEDLDGNLWLGTHNGISKFNFTNNTFVNYNSDYGLYSNISEIGASHLFSTGELLFGGNNGFNIFNPKEIKQNDYISPLILTSIKINDKQVSENIEKLKSLNLTHKENYISFEFTLTDYNNPFRHEYSVYLEGVDQNWKELGNRNFVSYTNIEPGNYILYIKGANEFGNWTNKPLTLQLNISPPFYRSIWFKILSVILILILAIILTIQIRNRQNLLEKLIKERTQKLEFAYRELLLKNTKIREQNRQIESHHNELEQKVTERTHDLEIAKRKAEESDNLKTSFLANMSHEIRTPLNAITGFSTLISNDVYDKERKQKYVKIINTNANSLLKLVEDILDISKIEAGQLKIEKDFFDFNSMIVEINTIFQEELKHKSFENVALVCVPQIPPEKNIYFKSDQLRIKQILVNLLNNAKKFTSKGFIEIGYQLNVRCIKFWVRDTGIGIRKKDLEYIFNRFTKVEEDKAIYRGTGLGLSISKSLVNMLNGTIWVESKENIGSCFFFEIPGDIIFNKSNRIEKVPKVTTKLNLEGKSVLIVEDEKSNYELLHSYLLNTKVEIVWAQNGLLAIDIFKKRKFDFILLDIRMPEIDGYETFDRIKKITDKG
ncbi:MAG: ATP-binding protein, partial [Prolixibacteraceae bacterium]|nr:ATP-binding protein [Prolixibacteraceae bacterium]